MTLTYGPTDIKESALELIGNTPLVALDRLWPGPGRVLAKCEFMNPGASHKDRAALSMIRGALKSGKLQPNGPIVEMTSGNTGAGLAVVSAVLEHPFTVTMSAGNDPQRAVMMRALGADVVLAPQIDGQPGKTSWTDVEAAIKLAETISLNTGAFLVDQWYNQDNSRAHEETTGPEIWRQTGGRVGAFVVMPGSAGSFCGTARYLKSKNPDIKCIVGEPEGLESIKLHKQLNNPGHRIQGAGYGLIPPLFTYDTMDWSLPVTEAEAVHYRDLLARKEGLYVGNSSGANVALAIKLLESRKLPPDTWVVTLLNDSGLKYAAD